METLKSRNGKEWGGLVTREEHRERNSLNELRLGCYRAIFMPSDDPPMRWASPEALAEILKRVMYPTDQEVFLNGSKYRWNFSGNCSKAKESFSQISSQFFIAGLWSKHLFNLPAGAVDGSVNIGELAQAWVYTNVT